MTHTPELLYVIEQNERDKDARCVRLKDSNGVFALIIDEKYVERFVALWNMAERLGLTTEAIEKGVIQDSYHALADHLVEEIVSGKIQRLEAEKAEMLAILEELRESSTCCGTYDLLDETTWASPDLADRIESAIRKARGEE